MPYVERLCDVRGGILDDDSLSSTGCVRSVLLLTAGREMRKCVDLREDLMDKGRRVKLEVKECFIVGYRGDVFVRSELLRYPSEKGGSMPTSTNLLDRLLYLPVRLPSQEGGIGATQQ